jgi:hypothetical protein
MLLGRFKQIKRRLKFNGKHQLLAYTDDDDDDVNVLRKSIHTIKKYKAA